MPVELHLYADGVVVRHDWSDPSQADSIRQFNQSEPRRSRLKNLLFAAFSFPEADWERLQRTNPTLFERDLTKRARAWMRFARSSDGRFFQVK